MAPLLADHVPQLGRGVDRPASARLLIGRPKAYDGRSGLSLKTCHGKFPVSPLTPGLGPGGPWLSAGVAVLDFETIGRPGSSWCGRGTPGLLGCP